MMTFNEMSHAFPVLDRITLDDETFNAWQEAAPKRLGKLFEKGNKTVDAQGWVINTRWYRRPEPPRVDYKHHLGYTDNFGHKNHGIALHNARKCPQVVAVEALFAKNATEDVQTMLCLPSQEAIDPSVDLRLGRETSFTVAAMVSPLSTLFWS